MAYVPEDLSSTKWHSHTSCSSTLFSFTGTRHVSAMSLFILSSPSAQGSLGAQQVPVPGRTICTSITKNNMRSAAFLRNFRPPGTSASKPAKGCTLLMQVWIWLFVQEFTCAVVAAGSGSSAMRLREAAVPVVHPISQHDVADSRSL